MRISFEDTGDGLQKSLLVSGLYPRDAAAGLIGWTCIHLGAVVRLELAR